MDKMIKAALTNNSNSITAVHANHLQIPKVCLRQSTFTDYRKQKKELIVEKFNLMDEEYVIIIIINIKIFLDEINNRKNLVNKTNNKFSLIFLPN